jgi:hypothetical protein
MLWVGRLRKPVFSLQFSGEMPVFPAFFASPAHPLTPVELGFPLAVWARDLSQRPTTASPARPAMGKINLRRSVLGCCAPIVMAEARRQQKDDIGVAVLTARAGLFRMGELTATKGAHDPVEDMAERDLAFLPNFWSASRVVVNLGRSKADQT